MGTIDLTIQDLRDMIQSQLHDTIEHYRDANKLRVSNYERPFGQPTDDEIDDFIFHIPHLDETLSKQLTNPGLLGFFAKLVNAEKQWLDDFKKQVAEWANNNSWIGGDDSTKDFILTISSPDESAIWYPNQKKPDWIRSSPSYRLLSEEKIPMAPCSPNRR